MRGYNLGVDEENNDLKFMLVAPLRNTFDKTAIADAMPKTN